MWLIPILILDSLWSNVYVYINILYNIYIYIYIIIYIYNHIYIIIYIHSQNPRSQSKNRIEDFACLHPLPDELPMFVSAKGNLGFTPWSMAC